MPSFDFSSPFVAARIIDRNGEAFPLWTSVGGVSEDRPTVPGGEDLQTLSFLQEVQIKQTLSFLPTITAQLAPPFREGMLFSNSHLANRAGENRIEVQIGYAGGAGDSGTILSPVFIANLFHPQVTIDMDVQIVLQGEGVPSLGNQPGTAVARSGETYEDVIRRVARGAGRDMQVDFNAVYQDAGEPSNILQQPATGFAQGGRSDWLALYQLSERTRCWMNLVGDTLYWIPRRARLMEAPVRTYRLYDFPGGRFRGVTEDELRAAESSGEMPILSFSTSSEHAWLPPQGVVQREVSDRDRTTVEEPVTPADQAEPVGADSGSERASDTEAAPADETTGRGFQMLPGDPEDEGSRTRATEDMARGTNLGLEVDLEVLGDPTIMPGSLVRLAGLGWRFDNPVYAVHTVTHVIGVSGYVSNLHIVTNIDPAHDEHEGGEAPTGPPNTAETEGGDDYTALPDLAGGGGLFGGDI